MNTPLDLTNEQLDRIAHTLAQHLKKALGPETPLRLHDIANHLGITQRQVFKHIENGDIVVHRFYENGIPYAFASKINERLMQSKTFREKVYQQRMKVNEY